MSGYMFERLERVDFEKRLACLYPFNFSFWRNENFLMSISNEIGI